MVFVNGKKIETNILDTKISILEKIASYFGTLPKYVSYTTQVPETFEENTRIKIVDLLQKIKESGESSISFQEFIENNKGYISDDIIIQEDILPLWLTFNKNLVELSEFDFTVLDSLKKELLDNNYITDESEFDLLWNDREEIKRRLLDNIESEKRKIENQNELYETLLNTEGNVHTDIKLERVSLEFQLNISNNSLFEIFNYIILNPSIPFVKCKNYYKILKDFSPLEEWLPESTEDGIFLYINQKRSLSDIYKNSTVAFIDSTGRVSVTINIGELFILNLEKFFEIFKSIFPTIKKFEISNVVENEVVGTFYFPQNEVDTYVFSDLVMNSSLFFSFISIDESTKATKRKSEDSSPWLYLHFSQPTTGLITAAVSEKYVDRGKYIMRIEDPELFPHGTSYIKVKAYGKNMVALQKFQEIFAKLITIYANEHDSIVKFYRKFLPNFAAKTHVDLPSRKKDHENAAPELFIKNYSRNCGDKRMPKLITAEEAKEMEEDKVIFFPRDLVGEAESHIPSDGKNQHFYICPNPEYPYPGIQNNKLDNSALFPYVPCCFKIPQNKPGGIFRKYFYNEDMDMKKKKQQDLVITDKILGENKYGTLSNELQKIFTVLDNNENHKYVRIGVQRTPSSFLNAVLLGLHDETDYLNYETSEERLEFVKKMRVKIAEYAITSKQNLFEYSETDIKDMILDENVYMDPKLFVQLLENFFSCNIYLFDKNRMILPKFMQGYYKNKYSSTSIIIYEHMGAEADHAKYPQCELIIKWNTTEEDDTDYYFQTESTIFSPLNTLFNSINESFSGSVPIKETEFSLHKDVLLKGQILDSFGKTQLLVVEHKKKLISIKTTPIAPLDIPVVGHVIHNTSKEIAEKIVNLSGGVFFLDLKDDKIVHGDIGTVRVTFYVSQESSNKAAVSELEKFNFNKKISTYLVQYLLWIFSKVLLKDNIEKITNKVINNFAKEFFVIIPNHTYSKIENKFTKKSPLLKDGKLIVTSEEMIKRLLYVLKLTIRRSLNLLRKYHTFSSMPNYYQDITDFTQYKNQVILQYSKVVEKWLQRDKNYLKLNKGVIQGDSPYFIKNSLMDDVMYLAQNTTSLEKALSICMNWQKNGYNPGKDPEVSVSAAEYSFVLFSYKNPDEITRHEIKGNTEIFNPFRVIGYKINDVAFYTALIEV